MGTIWTPGGERPVAPAPGSGPAPPPPKPHAAPTGGDGMAAEPDEAELAAMREQLARTPAAVIVTNHCMGLWELAALHLSLRPPQLDQATVAIDALGAIVERLEGRLGDDEGTVRDALAQLRLAFVQVKAVAAGGAFSGADDGRGRAAPAATNGDESRLETTAGPTDA